MSRRSRGFAVRHVDGERASIGDSHVEAACNALDRACGEAAAMFVPQRFNREQILPWFFNDTDLAKLRMCRHLVRSKESLKNYEVMPNMLLQIHFVSNDDVATVPTIEESAFMPNMSRCTPLIEAAKVLADLHFQYGRVKHMLRWFNKHATPGAIRNYWPAVMSLCPKAPMVLELAEAPTRYSIPTDIGKMLPLIRDTANTVAAMALIPADQEHHAMGNVRLTMVGHKAMFEGVDVDLNAHSFNL